MSVRSLSVFLFLCLAGCSGPPPAPPGEALLAEGRRQFADGDPAAAARSIEAALTEGVREPALAETSLGNALVADGRVEEAKERHLRAISLDPDLHVAWVNLGISQRLLGDYAGAAESYARAEELAPDYAELHASKGALALSRGDAATAEVSLRRAIALSPDLAVPHANLALALAELGRREEAEAALKEAVARGYAREAVVRARIEAAR